MKTQILSFDWKEFSKEGFDSFKKSLETFGIYLYELDFEIHKEPYNPSDWILLLSDKPLSKIEMREIWKGTFE